MSLSFGVLIIISERDMFDYRAGEPNENKLTVLRALEVSPYFFCNDIAEKPLPLHSSQTTLCYAY